LSRVNPLIQALSLILAAALLGLAFLIGAVVIGVLLAVGAVAALIIAMRIWWLQRKIRAGTAGNPSGRSAQQVIEGDYTIVSETDGKPGLPRSVPRDDAQSRPSDAAD
jgi:predicted lipid-binding transport protein (Tim44 family)